MVFYEKKLANIVQVYKLQFPEQNSQFRAHTENVFITISPLQSMDVNIAVEKKKKDRLEARLKFLLDDNDTLSMQLAGIRKDLKKCQSLTETLV